jgi:hypothetical protein
MKTAIDTPTAVEAGADRHSGHRLPVGLRAVWLVQAVALVGPGPGGVPVELRPHVTQGNHRRGATR